MKQWWKIVIKKLKLIKYQHYSTVSNMHKQTDKNILLHFPEVQMVYFTAQHWDALNVNLYF